ncbi:hypothetical protein BABINDRAFT_163246 [Babjeviella inositovora NRRL Y-12698]|uniref:Uncharacterized protein n=1 Tax=Babjeviella inositovora NRRL Y-12698 TaxID=984486 RepID=A0A1E3QJK1_9ASCO|nr:uncharacterized protein BABINDRAFT_163246 [Babjeviella inositovora NRRL Y-12698]ODQ77871.1 hypothetical protein BABINDRAFT_163246 [Babjeviella inositovora NRRL Y-12698]
MSSILKLNAIKTSARCFIKNTSAVNRGFSSTHAVHYTPTASENENSTVIFRNNHAQNLHHEPISESHCAHTLAQKAQSSNWFPSVSSNSEEIHFHGSVHRD